MRGESGNQMESNRLKLQVPTGTGDYLPDECAEKRRVERKIREEFKKCGYNEIETPAFEYYDVFMHDSVPYVQEDMIKFFDRKGRILALRPDMTGPIARLAATKLLREKEVLRLCYIGNVYGVRREGGKTEYTQAGVELIGKDGAEADAEVITLAIQSLLETDLRAFKIDIGQVSYFKGLLTDACIGEEQVEKIRMLIDSKNTIELEYELSRMDVSEQIKRALLELPGLFGGAEVLERANAPYAACRAAVENIREVYQILCDFGYGNVVTIDFGMLNNFNYYSGIIFRGMANGIGVPLLSGGRYDDLLREFGADYPATGFAVGIKELLIVLEKQGMLRRNDERIMVLKYGRGARERAYRRAQELRGTEKRVIIEENGPDYVGEDFEVVRFD
jgi:ATP phosphoribosyltransferase regulatory subunit